MAGPRWTHLDSARAQIVPLLANALSEGAFLDRLVTHGCISYAQQENIRRRLSNVALEDMARDLLSVLRLRPPLIFDIFCAILQHGNEKSLYDLIASTTRSESDARCRALQEENARLNRELQTTKIELETLRESHVSLSQDSETQIAQGLQTAGFIASSKTDDVDRKVTDEELRRLVPYLIEDKWKELSSRLETIQTSSEIHRETLELAHWSASDPKELVYSMLNDWHIVNGSDATVKSICSALVRRPVIHRLAAEEVFGVGVVKQVLRYLGD